MDYLTFPSFFLAILAVFAGITTVIADTNIGYATCEEIATSVSSASAVYYLGPDYDWDMFHWASSSTQLAACSFEPGTPEDVGIALQIIGRNNCPFAVKGGGHATNPGFSSTTGVHIAMTRFQDVTYNQTAQAATIGAGLIWDDVYAALEPYAVNVVGGRVSGVGVAGLILGGGYSWLTNQYGLTIDTVQAYELVLPNGTVIDVTQSSSPDLFFALKGGFNNFGIVTRFTLMTVPQGQVWGGPIMYSEAVVEQVTAATADFSANCTDPKAQLITTYNYLAGLPVISELLFYDGPSPPAGVFDKFLAIPSLSEDVSTRSFLSLVRSYPGNETTGLRGVFNSVSVTGFPEELLDLVLEEAVYWSTSLLPLAGLFVSYDVEPFLPTIFTHNSTPSAYPGSRERAVFPINIYFAWALALDDDAIQNATRISAERLYNKAVELGQPIEGAPLYPNYALSDEPLEDMYGDNVEALKRIKDSVDPDNVMGLAGGFKF